jgi:hypothetical protein
MFAIPDGSQSNGYEKRGRKPGRRTDYMNDPIVNAKRELALTRMSAASTQQSGQMTPLPLRPLILQAAQTYRMTLSTLRPRPCLPGTHELDDWQLYGPKNIRIFELVVRLTQDHGIRVSAVEQILEEALLRKLKQLQNAGLTR